MVGGEGVIVPTEQRRTEVPKNLFLLLLTKGFSTSCSLCQVTLKVDFCVEKAIDIISWKKWYQFLQAGKHCSNDLIKELWRNKAPWMKLAQVYTGSERRPSQGKAVGLSPWGTADDKPPIAEGMTGGEGREGGMNPGMHPHTLWFPYLLHKVCPPPPFFAPPL